MRRLMLALVLISAIGCRDRRYQMVAVGQYAYRLDRKTGEMLMVVRESAWPVGVYQKRPVLP